MTASRINPAYRLGIRLDLWLSSFITAYCEVAYHGAVVLEQAGILTLWALVHWSYARSLFDRESYFLYEQRGHIEVSVESYRDSLAEHMSLHRHRMLNFLVEKMAYISKQLHARGCGMVIS